MAPGKQFPNSRIVQTAQGKVQGRRLIYEGEKQVDAFQVRIFYWYLQCIFIYLFNFSHLEFLITGHSLRCPSHRRTSIQGWILSLFCHVILLRNRNRILLGMEWERRRHSVPDPFKRRNTRRIMIWWATVTCPAKWCASERRPIGGLSVSQCVLSLLGTTRNRFVTFIFCDKRGKISYVRWMIVESTAQTCWFILRIICIFFRFSRHDLHPRGWFWVRRSENVWRW